MSNLRIFGIIMGLIGISVSFGMFRAGKWNRNNFILLSLSSMALLTVSINPGLLNIIEEMLSLEKSQRGRIISLIIFSSITMWFVILYMRNVSAKQKLQFDKIVREVAAWAFEKDMLLKLADNDICILIPAFNESDNLQELLPKIPHEACGKKVGVLVVDDGSDDDTYFAALKAGAFAVKSPVNRGGGAALRLGYDLLRKAGVKVCVTLDADGQHAPEEVSKLVSPILEDLYDITIGSRILGSREKDSLSRLFGIYVFSFIGCSSAKNG